MILGPNVVLSLGSVASGVEHATVPSRATAALPGTLASQPR